MPISFFPPTQNNNSLADKWASSGLLDGLHTTTNTNIASLLESQASQLLYYEEPENIYTRIVIFEKYKKYKVYRNSNSSFESVGIPMVRRVFSQMIAQDLVSVQPLAAPTGTLFFFDEIERENVYKKRVLIEKDI